MYITNNFNIEPSYYILMQENEYLISLLHFNYTYYYYYKFLVADRCINN